MLSRKIQSVLCDRLDTYPAAALVGPRQCGKTTLAKSLCGRYYDLEQESDRLRLDLEWNQAVESRQMIILDEAQAWPDVFPMLRGAIDSDRRRNGRFLLLGSISPSLMTQVSESLAGRLALVELAPLSVLELRSEAELQRRWLVGGYPDGGVLSGRGFPSWHMNYLQLLAARDLPQWGMPGTARSAERLFHMLASLHGQEWNASQLGKSLGISYHTVNRYLDYLDGAFLVRRLPAWHRNIGKRIVKRPKVYWRDSGLLHALLGVADEQALMRQPWVGASWEGFVVDQTLTTLGHSGRDWRAFYMRTRDQREIDLVLELDGEVWALEIKLTARPSRGDLARLNANADLIGAHRRLLVCQSAESLAEGDQFVCNLEWLLEFLCQDVESS